MPLLREDERRFMTVAARASQANPFEPELLACEQEALGGEFVPEEPHWSFDVVDPLRPRHNAWRIAQRLTALTAELRARLRAGEHATERELALYEEACLHVLYYRYFHQINRASFSEASSGRWSFYRAFLQDWAELFHLPSVTLPGAHEPAHTFALFYQLVRAFHHTFDYILGSSRPAGRLRAAVWQAIFTRDLRAYRRSYYERMGDYATLITGPSGTGKELVARAVALSRYHPFDAQRLTFPASETLFLPLNIAALTPTLVESELFGHRKGSFTGAMADRKGYLESCSPLGAVFLDELGELGAEVQVKLLRVIETRTFQVVGDSTPRRFSGKLIAATNRNLAEAIAKGQFREDLYYRLCSDLIHTPSLAQQVAESPDVLQDLVRFMARRAAGDDADRLAEEALAWINRHLGRTYPWPGNYRELEQCVRNIAIRGEYHPAHTAAKPADGPAWVDRLVRGQLSAEEVLNHYCRLVYTQTGTYEGAAERLGLDRRTVKARVTQ